MITISIYLVFRAPMQNTYSTVPTKYELIEIIKATWTRDERDNFITILLQGIPWHFSGDTKYKDSTINLRFDALQQGNRTTVQWWHILCVCVSQLSPCSASSLYYSKIRLPETSMHVPKIRLISVTSDSLGRSWGKHFLKLQLSTALIKYSHLICISMATKMAAMIGWHRFGEFSCSVEVHSLLAQNIIIIMSKSCRDKIIEIPSISNIFLCIYLLQFKVLFKVVFRTGMSLRWKPWKERERGGQGAVVSSFGRSDQFRWWGGRIAGWTKRLLDLFRACTCVCMWCSVPYQGWKTEEEDFRHFHGKSWKPEW